MPVPDSFGCAAGCGRCCDPVRLTVPPGVLAALAEHVPGMQPAEAANTSWALDHFNFVEDTEDGLFAYACDAYDPGTARCTMHGERPPMCRDWPDNVPSNLQPMLPAQCSYNWGLPVRKRGPIVGRLLPLTPV